MINFRKALMVVGVCLLALSFGKGHVYASGNSAATVNATSVNMRSGPSTSSKVVGLLQNGSKLTVLSQSGSWYKVSTAKGNIGWVSTKYVSVAKSTPSRGGERTTTSRGGSNRVSTVSGSVTEYAKTFQGVRYSWGGTTTNGFDCSGYTSFVFRNFGVKLNRVAADQATQGTYVSKGDLAPGDLVFFDTDGGHNYINHAGIYLGDGMFIHASSGIGKVAISNLNQGYYLNAYMTARRVL